MKKLVAICAVLVTVTASLMAAPVTGTYDSRTEGSTIIANVPYVEGATVSSFWEDVTGDVGMFDAWGYSGDTQWYIEAHDPAWEDGIYCGFIQLNSFGNAPWFGDNPTEVGGYEGLITEWTLEETYTGEVLDLVLRGTAVLDKKHMMPWYPITMDKFVDMSPVSISFEMGFNGVSDEGYIGGTPDYLVVTVIPEPATISILAIGALGLIRRKK
ncbi:MAG: PEP-CTERM sorting domain-containing protein [Planctomycetaceae bacterium]|nr:PEP-CTERM sorting domain-containing protein [Planctomycetaceae bacterium]